MSQLDRLRRGKRGAEEINISPLIDMMFILLIFFVVTTTFVKDLKIDIERPGAATAERADVRAIRVAVDRGGKVYIDGQQIHTWMVQSRVRELLSENPDRPVLVISDRRLETGRMVEVVDQCRLAGAKNVGVDVERTE